MNGKNRDPKVVTDSSTADESIMVGGFVFDGDYQNHAQVEAYFEDYLTAYAEAQREMFAARVNSEFYQRLHKKVDDMLVQNQDLRGRIPGIAGDDEDTAIYLLGKMQGHKLVQKKVDAFVSQDGVQEVDRSQLPFKRNSPFMHGTVMRFYDETADNKSMSSYSEMTLHEDSRLLVDSAGGFWVLRKGARKRGFWVHPDERIFIQPSARSKRLTSVPKRDANPSVSIEMAKAMKPHQAAILQDLRKNQFVGNRTVVEVGRDYLLLRGSKGSVTMLLTERNDDGKSVPKLREIRARFTTEEVPVIRVLVLTDDDWRNGIPNDIERVSDAFNRNAGTPTKNYFGATFHAAVIEAGSDAASAVYKRDNEQRNRALGRWATGKGAGFMALFTEVMQESVSVEIESIVYIVQLRDLLSSDSPVSDLRSKAKQASEALDNPDRESVRAWVRDWYHYPLLSLAKNKGAAATHIGAIAAA